MPRPNSTLSHAKAEGRMASMLFTYKIPNALHAGDDGLGFTLGMTGLVSRWE